MYRRYQSLRDLHPLLEPRVLEYLAGLRNSERRRAELDRLEISLDETNVASLWELLSVFKECLERLLADEPFENVYHAAIGMLAWADFFRQTPDFSHAYRGQRKEWPILPSLYRGKAAVDRAEYELRLEALRRAVLRLRQQFDGVYSTEELVAICQHYGVPTWLIDVSTDPWVALYFASFGGESGDVGIVYLFDDMGWKDLDPNGTGHIGRFWKTVINGVPRIEAQRGFFISGAHPEIFEGFVPFRVRFFQYPGLIFEDNNLSVTKALLLPERDSIPDILTSRQEVGNDRLSVPAFPDEYLTLHWYESISLDWLRALGVQEPPSDVRAFVQDVCRFHMSVQPYSNQAAEPFPVTARALLRLKWVVESAADFGTEIFPLQAKTAVGQYFFHAKNRAGELHAKLKEIVQSSGVPHIWRAIEDTNL